MAEPVDSRAKKKALNARLEAATALQLLDKFDEAREMLLALADSPDQALLGHQTALGLPRRLQSALMKLAKAEKDAVKRIGYQYHSVPPPSLLAPITRVSSAHRKAVVSANRQAVPRRIHQIWVGPNAKPLGTDAWKAYADAQGYDYQLWTEDELQDLGIDQNPVYQDMLQKGDFPGAVDVARYAILEKSGGIYLDCDWYPARNDVSFDDFLPMTGLTTMAEDIPRKTGKGGLLLANSMIATPAHHPVFTKLNAVLPDVMKLMPDAPAWWATGPLIFTLIARGGSVTLADADIIAGALPQATPLNEVELWCKKAREEDLGLFLAWKSWVWR